MAIKPIDVIPESENQKRRSYRERIREDLQRAIDQRITRFEFEGDYNYKYLAQYAREEADYIWRKAYRDEMGRQLHKNKMEEERISRYPDHWMKGNYIKIRSVKMPDRIHVYGEIDAKYPEKICASILNQYIEEQKKADNIIKSGDLSAHICDIGLSVRSVMCLQRAGYIHVAQLQGMTIESLMQIRNLGRKSAEEIIEKMKLFEGEKGNGDKDES